MLKIYKTEICTTLTKYWRVSIRGKMRSCQNWSLQAFWESDQKLLRQYKFFSILKVLIDFSLKIEKKTITNGKVRSLLGDSWDLNLSRRSLFIAEMWGMITWVMVGLLLAAETTCGRNLVSGNESGTKEDTTRQKSGLKGTSPDEEDIYRELWVQAHERTASHREEWHFLWEKIEKKKQILWARLEFRTSALISGCI